MDFSALQKWLSDIALSLDDSQKKELMRKLSMGLKRRMAQRIKNQNDPNGFKFVPRKRDQIGNKKRTGALFQGITRQIKYEYTADSASVGFAGRTGNIARIHQEGLTDKPTAIAQPTAYPVRELVGFSDDDVKWIETQIIDYMSKLL